MEVSSVLAVGGTNKEAAADPARGWKHRLQTVRRLDWWPRSEEAAVPMWVHGLFWGLLLFFDGLIIFFDYTNPKNQQPLEYLLLRAVFTDVLSAILFYTNWMVLIPRTLSRGRLWPYVAGVLLLVLAYIPLRFGVSWMVKGAAEDVHDKQRALSMLVPYGVMGLMAIFLSSALRITGDYLRGQRNRREMERQQLLIELAMLKTQINPHFLFNTLNNIYSLTSRKSDKAPEAVLRLSEIMRYLLYESSTDTVPLSRELAHLRSFLDLQRLRLSATAQEAIQLTVTGAPADCAYPIAPLLLLPLVENAFKHGDLAARPVAVHITLDLAADGQLRFSVLNHVAAADAERELPNQPGGVGLVNLRRRLALLYPGRHTLEVQTPPGQHLVTLILG
ncbi:sensor histidine kinase [Hymenobacter sp. BT186]|uniref:Sensor histidine kinase n=1 Tax=Hymenobacter telluris TaxID=2816474 RepID=A0A939ETP6_9BACT|nr:sensor histidine kinase [Hymenobacter telluris]MBO0357091.1 sensor histidine kinase [Hymenobacter telluris]MBW3373118.1 sensor histidine kinase [Hymenobacter norwichensis]